MKLGPVETGPSTSDLHSFICKYPEGNMYIALEMIQFVCLCDTTVEIATLELWTAAAVEVYLLQRDPGKSLTVGHNM